MLLAVLPLELSLTLVRERGVLASLEAATAPRDRRNVLEGSQPAVEDHIARGTSPVCLDVPRAKATYDAVIRVPNRPGMRAIMSAPERGDAAGRVDGEHRVFEFEQKVPIPSYLFNINAGYIERRQVGERTVVYAMPDVIDAAVAEFGDKFELNLRAFEEVSTPYIWGNLGAFFERGVFAYGGMENPSVMTLTPTLLAGDGSNSDVVAHEIQHSASGNLVTNAYWSAFWLNEGLTGYFFPPFPSCIGRCH